MERIDLNRISRFVMHNLIEGPEKNLHVVARNNFLSQMSEYDMGQRVLQHKFVQDVIDKSNKSYDDLFDTACGDLFAVSLMIQKRATELDEEGVNVQDKVFMDRLIADTNRKVEEEFKDDPFLP